MQPGAAATEQGVIGLAIRQFGYQRVVDAVAAEIGAGVLRPGDPLPSIKKLAAAHGVSTSTVKLALVLLRRDGLIVGEQGVATYVAERPPE